MMGKLCTFWVEYTCIYTDDINYLIVLYLMIKFWNVIGLFSMFYKRYSRTCIIGVRAPPPPHDPPKSTFL